VARFAGSKPIFVVSDVVAPSDNTYTKNRRWVVGVRISAPRTSKPPSHNPSCAGTWQKPS